jgi:hypothetical protein
VPDDASSDAGREQNEVEQRAALRVTVQAAFVRVNSGQPGSISLVQLPALLMALDTTYSEERHARALAALLDADDSVSLQRFSDWYVSLIFADDKSDTVTATRRDIEAVTDTFSAQLKTAAGGGWRCGSCYFMNSAEEDQCAICNKPSPAATAAAATADAAAAAAVPEAVMFSSSLQLAAGGVAAATLQTPLKELNAQPANHLIRHQQQQQQQQRAAALEVPLHQQHVAGSGRASTSGFSFETPATAASAAVDTTALRSVFSSSSALAAPVFYTASATVSGGFRFAPAAAAATRFTASGATAADTATPTADTTTAAATGGFSFTPTFTPGRTAVVAAVTAAPAAAPAAQFTEGDVDFEVGCVVDDTISDTDSYQEDHQKREKESATVAAAFAELNPSQPDVISDSQFPALFEAHGTTFSVAAYARTLATLSGTDGYVSLQHCSDWYIHWLFDDDDSSSSDSDSEYHDAIAKQ